MSENKNWTEEVKNNENMIDGLEDCTLFDDSTTESIIEKDDEIDIDSGEEMIITNFADSDEEIVELEELKEEDDFRYISKNQDIEVQPQKELTLEERIELAETKKRDTLNQQRQWADDFLDNFPVEKNKDLENKLDEDDNPKDIDNTIEIQITKEEYPIDIPPEVAVDEEDINIVKPKDFKELVDTKGEILENYISGSSKFNSISETLGVCVELCKLFASVHEMDCCFNGITGKDIVLTKNKECKLLDDKKIVSVDDDTYQINYEKTCAPEVLKNEARPNINTDKHSMAFLLFGLLFKSDPFEGSKVLNTPCYNVEDELKYYEEPIFVYSHKDKSNMPVYGIHSVLIKYWNRFYPEGIKMLFKQMFVIGIENPESRSDDKMCIEKLLQFKNIVDSKNTKKEPTKNKKESTLKEKISEKFKHHPKSEMIDSSDFEQKENTIEIDKDAPKKPVDESLPKYRLYASYVYYGSRELENMKLTPGTEIKSSFIGYEELKNNDVVIGKVIENSKHKGVLGIKNMSNHEWIAYKGSSAKKFPPGKVLVLSDKVEIDFYPENKSESKTQWYIRKVQD